MLDRSRNATSVMIIKSYRLLNAMIISCPIYVCIVSKSSKPRVEITKNHLTDNNGCSSRLKIAHRSSRKKIGCCRYISRKVLLNFCRTTSYDSRGISFASCPISTEHVSRMASILRSVSSNDRFLQNCFYHNFVEITCRESWL